MRLLFTLLTFTLAFGAIMATCHPLPDPSTYFSQGGITNGLNLEQGKYISSQEVPQYQPLWYRDPVTLCFVVDRPHYL